MNCIFDATRTFMLQQELCPLYSNAPLTVAVGRTRFKRKVERDGYITLPSRPRRPLTPTNLIDTLPRGILSGADAKKQFGKTPILPPAELQEMGYTIAAYPLSLLSASIKAMNAALARLKAGEPLDDMLEGFEEVQRVVGFRDYDETAANYKID